MSECGRTSGPCRIATVEPCGPNTSTIVQTSPIWQSSPNRPSSASICSATTCPILLASSVIYESSLEPVSSNRFSRPRRHGVGLAQLCHRRAHRFTRVRRLEHRGVTGFLQDLAHQPVCAREAQLDYDRAVAALLHDPPCLPRPARALGKDQYPRRARGLHLAGAQPAIDLRRRIDLRPWLEALLGHVHTLDPVQTEVTHRVALGIKRRDVPALAPVRQRVGLDPALDDLVLVLLVVLELDNPPLHDRGRDHPRDPRIVAPGVGYLQALLHRILAERRDDLLARGSE